MVNGLKYDMETYPYYFFVGILTHSIYNLELICSKKTPEKLYEFLAGYRGLCFLPNKVCV